jgi:hypothetical protein
LSRYPSSGSGGRGDRDSKSTLMRFEDGVMPLERKADYRY